MNHKLSPALQTDFLEYDDRERKLVDKLAQDAVEYGLCPQTKDLVNLYVSLKSKPLLILSGSAFTGNIALLNYLATSLTGGKLLQCQTTIGHPWWANKDPNVAFFVDVQHRLITERLLDMIEEAWRPQNVQKMYIACLTQISPVELLDFFCDVVFQLNHGQLMRLGDAHLIEPIPYPPNMFIIGTINTDRSVFWEADLLKKATIVHGSQQSNLSASCALTDANSASLGAVLLRSSIRNEVDACRKLPTILGEYRTTHHKGPLLPIFKVENLLTHFGVSLPTDWLEGSLIYLANSWTREGEGLFDHSTSRNLSMALDFAIAQSVLLYGKDHIQASKDLQIELKRILKGQFPYSTFFVDWLAGTS